MKLKIININSTINFTVGAIMIMKKNIYILIIFSSSNVFSTSVASEVVPSAHKLQNDLHAAHNQKLAIVQEADKKGYFSKIMECHQKISSIETHWATMVQETLNCQDCTTAKCQIMRLIHQISFNIQSLMKLIKPEDLIKIQELNLQIHNLKLLLKKYNLEDKTFKEHPISVYL